MDPERKKEIFLDLVRGYSFLEAEQRLSLNRQDSVDQERVTMAVKHLWQLCTSQYGFLTQVSTEVTLKNSVTSIPNIFDTAFIMDVLHTSGIEIPASIKHSVKTLFLDNRGDCDLWNYFISGFHLFPDDMDTSVNVVLGLVSCGMNNATVLKMANNVYKSVVFHEDGIPDNYFPSPSKMSRSIYSGSNVNPLDLWRNVRRVDIGVVANFLYMLNKTGVDHLPAQTPCYSFLQNLLKQVEETSDGSILLLHTTNYRDVDVLLYLISRLCRASEEATKQLQDFLGRIVQRRTSPIPSDPVTLACRILTAVYCKLYTTKAGKTQIMRMVKCLQGMQDSEDYSYPKHSFYSAHGIYHFGSDALSISLAVAAITEALRVIAD